MKVVGGHKGGRANEQSSCARRVAGLCVCVLEMSDTEFAFCFTGLFYEGFPELGWIQAG